MAETRIWVHGVAFEANFPADFVELPSLAAGQIRSVERTESGSEFRSAISATHGFHVSIPSPTILNDFTMRLRRVFIFYDTNGATIRSVRVLDGPRLVRNFPNLGWSGGHSNSFDASNQLTLTGSQSISNGIGLFVEVDFSGLTQPPGTFSGIRFSTAGVELVTGQRLITTIILWFASLFERQPT